MKVMVACEESQRVCTEFRHAGHEAYSADVQKPSGGHPEWHILGDVLPYINGSCTFKTMDGAEHNISGTWDLLIAHPPCTYISKAGGNRLRIDGEIQKERFLKGLSATDFFMKFYFADCNKIAIENPIPLKIFGIPKYSQIIQPYMFGDPWMKTTCLWLKGLPPLLPDNIVKPTGKWVNASDHRKHKRKDEWQTTGVKSAKQRSKTFPGIARAMAAQWSNASVDFDWWVEIGMIAGQTSMFDHCK